MTTATGASSRDAEVASFPEGSRLSSLTVAREIERLVGEGRLVAGQRLVAGDLAERFNVSRTTIREALSLLSGEGIVEIIPNSGGRIRRIGPQRLADMLDVFAAIFQAATAKLLSRPLTEAREPLNSALADILAAADRGNGGEQLEALLAYHYLIARICGNDYFLEALNRLHIGHFVKQAGIEGYLRKDVDVSMMYRKLHDRLMKRDAAGAFEIWKPEIDRLAEHLRRQ